AAGGGKHKHTENRLRVRTRAPVNALEPHPALKTIGRAHELSSRPGVKSQTIRNSHRQLNHLNFSAFAERSSHVNRKVTTFPRYERLDQRSFPPRRAARQQGARE